MQVWPAIDLRGGKCVRLRQGDYQQETIFALDPATAARQFADQGATHLHIVDLEGARGAVQDLAGVALSLEGAARRLDATDADAAGALRRGAAQTRGPADRPSGSGRAGGPVGPSSRLPLPLPLPLPHPASRIPHPGS